MGFEDSVGGELRRTVCESIEAAEKLFVRGGLSCSAAAGSGGGGDGALRCDHDAGCRGSVAIFGRVERVGQRGGLVTGCASAFAGVDL